MSKSESHDINWEKLAKLEILKMEDINKIKQLNEIEPIAAFAKIRNVFERLIKRLFEYYFRNQENLLEEHIPLGKMLYYLNEKEIFPSELYIQLNALRMTCNTAIHDNVHIKKALEMILPTFLVFIEWYTNDQIDNLISQDIEKLGGEDPIRSQGHFLGYNMQESIKEDLNTRLRENIPEISRVIEFAGIKIDKRESEILKKIEDLTSKKFIPNVSINSKDEEKYIGFEADNGHVVKLKITNSKIQKIPDLIIKLKYLKSLNLSSNEIDNIPGWLFYLDSLEEINLSNNPIQKIPVLNKPAKSFKIIYIPANIAKKINKKYYESKNIFLKLEPSKFLRMQKQIFSFILLILSFALFFNLNQL
ncbi:MAG: hypothetical protein ACTSXU_08500, partial [Promethearchaeota archaeon]